METSMVGGMCRCCASEGAFKDVKTCYSWMGEDEVYADMLKDCFDIHLGSSSSGQYGGICEVCITQLRNAANFKKQVQQTEEQFKQLESRFFSTSIVKIEAPPDEDTIIHHDSDDNMHDSIDETFSANECEIKSEVPEEKPKKRARATTSRAAKKAKVGDPDTTVKREPREENPTIVNYLSSLKNLRVTRTVDHDTKMKPIKIKKPDNIKTLVPYIVEEEVNQDDVDPKPKRIIIPVNLKPKENKASGTSTLDEGPKNSENKILMKPIKIKIPSDVVYEPPNVIDELAKQRHNIQELIIHSNATPIRKYIDLGYMCCFCSERFEKPADLKAHTIAHDEATKRKFMNNKGMSPFVVKLDITSLKCNICSQALNSVEGLMEHIKGHGIKLYSVANNHIVPFRFTDDVRQTCVVCMNPFSTFKSLFEHMHSHYRNYVCPVCDAGFINRNIFRVHSRTHKMGVFHCGYCSKVYDTQLKKTSHENAIHLKLLNKCNYCREKFKNYDLKRIHMENVHGVKIPLLECKACGKKFRKPCLLKYHVERDHLMERPYPCTECDMKFRTLSHLKAHLPKHSETRDFECQICLKAFARSKTLRQHMRVHKKT